MGSGLEEKIELSLDGIIEVNADDRYVSGLLGGKVSEKFKYFLRGRNLRVPLLLSENVKIKMIFNDEEIEEL